MILSLLAFYYSPNDAAHILVETEDGAGMIEHDWVIITVRIYT